MPNQNTNDSAAQTSTAGNTATMSNTGLFTQYKQWVSFKQAGGTVKVGQYFERVSGGDVQYEMAEAAPANSRGSIYRSTRFRISELTMETLLRMEDYLTFAKVFDAFRRDSNKKMSVERLLRDNLGQPITYAYGNCSVMQPPLPDDGDVGRGNEMLMMRIRLQPESLIITGQGGAELMRYDPADALDSGYYNDQETNKQQ